MTDSRDYTNPEHLETAVKELGVYMPNSIMAGRGIPPKDENCVPMFPAGVDKTFSTNPDERPTLQLAVAFDKWGVQPQASPKLVFNQQANPAPATPANSINNLFNPNSRT